MNAKDLIAMCSARPSYADELLAQSQAEPGQEGGACEWKPGMGKKKAIEA